MGCENKLVSAFTLLAILYGAVLTTDVNAQDSKAIRRQESAQVTRDDLNRRLMELSDSADASVTNNMVPSKSFTFYIGPEDLLEISVFEVPELNRTTRVTDQGEISFPLLGMVGAAGLSPRELESVLEEQLQLTFLKEPHVGVFVRQMQSHPVSVFGAVQKPGVYQIRSPKSVVEILARAEGLASDAGDTVTVQRGNYWRAAANVSRASLNTPLEGAQEAVIGVGQSRGTKPVGELTIRINLKSLLESGDARRNVLVFPGDTVTVNKAGIVYVIGAVKKAGGFVLESNENISVLQALALAEGLKGAASKGKTMIIRTDPVSGIRREIRFDLGKVLKGKAPDPMLQPKDILFVPNSAVRAGLIRAGETAISIVSGVIIWRR